MRLTMGSRIGVVGRNGAGKSTRLGWRGEALLENLGQKLPRSFLGDFGMEKMMFFSGDDRDSLEMSSLVIMVLVCPGYLSLIIGLTPVGDPYPSEVVP